MFYGEIPLGEDVYGLEPRRYLDVIMQQNRTWHDSLRGLLGFIPSYSPYALAVVGSDGRLERHEKQGTDIIAITKSPDAYPYWDLGTYLGQYGFHIEDCDTNVYDISQVERLSVVQGLRGGKVFPDYLLYSDPIAGDKGLWVSARERVLFELQDPKIHRDIRQRNRKEYAKAAKTGTYSKLPVFDVIDGVQYYQEDESHAIQLGFKIPFLRLVQSWLDLKTIDYIDYFKFDQKIIKSLSEYMPTSTSDRLCFLGQHGGINQEWEDIYQAYGWFLREYHYAQEQYIKFGRRESLFDIEEFAYYSQVLLMQCEYARN